MKLAHISTTNGTKQISCLGDIDFCLAPFVLEDKKYSNYFNNSKRFVIMDNGVAEDYLISNDELVKLAIKLKVNELIIPDKIGNYEDTKKMREEFLEKYYKQLKKNKIKIMSVIQGETWEEYVFNLYELEKDKRIDTIGIPFRIDYEFEFFDNFNIKEQRSALKRLYFINENTFKKPVHLLGCNSIFELNCFRNNKKIRSMDSKLITRYAKSLEDLKDGETIKPKEKLYLNDVLTKEQITFAKNLIKKLKGGKNGRHK